ESRWFGGILRGDDGGVMHEPSVRVFVTGAGSWRTEREFPSGRARDCALHLDSGGRANSALGDGRLTLAIPSASMFDGIVSDPMDLVPYPVDALGLPLYAPIDCRSIERRDDVLVYTTGVLAAAAEVAGAVTVTVFVATDAAATDMVARLVDVHPNGRAVRVADGIARAVAAVDAAQACQIDLGLIAHAFARGHRIRLEVASSAYPRWSCSQGQARAKSGVWHGAPHPSRVMLPVIGGAIEFCSGADECTPAAEECAHE
ncbi:MAG: CocE/NonD family hydrolase, partial [Firmicutes bacterium]|nr:CocE/NonD family hydrolase [Bacillota bacterium]